MSGREYNYAAINFPIGSQRRWAVTNTVTGDAGRYTWDGLLNFMGEANWPSLHQVTAFTPLAMGAPAVVERVGAYGKVTATEQVEDYHGKAGPSMPTYHPFRR